MGFRGHELPSGGAKGSTLTKRSKSDFDVDWQGGDAACVKAIQSTGFLVPNNVITQIQFTDPDAWDTDGFHDPAGAHPERITIPAGLGGRYEIKAPLGIGNSGVGFRKFSFEVNGAFDYAAAQAAPDASGFYRDALVDDLDLLAGDFITVYSFHNAGAPLTVVGSFQLRRVGPVVP